jgi:hypothetical protein
MLRKTILLSSSVNAAMGRRANLRERLGIHNHAEPVKFALRRGIATEVRDTG